VELEDVAAPQPVLQDAVDEAFQALRKQAAAETGWDVLSSLENAYVPLTSPPAPSVQDDWLYTGRAFAANPLLLSANYMVITREDFSGRTFWRVYLKARYQDGSMGAPLAAMVWDLNARYSGDARAYEEGGKFGQVPPGYWIDFTEITSRYGWEREAARINWRTFYPSIRFNQFVITGGLEWRQAMSDLYPPEALMSATPLPTHTSTVTITPKFTPRPVTLTPTPSITPVLTRRPTWTPLSQP
jgi:TolB protein